MDAVVVDDRVVGDPVGRVAEEDAVLAGARVAAVDIVADDF